MAEISLKRIKLASEEDKVTIKEEISSVEEMCTVYIKEEDEKMEKDNIKEEISSVEEMCTVYIKEEDDKMENTEIKGCLKSATN